MPGNKLCIYLFATVYCIITISVPNNPNYYTLAIDVFSCSLSFASCIALQTFLAKQDTILGGLCIQFLGTEELAILQYLTLGLIANTANTDLSRFYAEYPEIAKYVMNNLPVGCCICGYLFILSTARLLLIYSPAYYQGLNRSTCLRLSAAFIVLTVISDLLINHVRCLITHSKDYNTISISQTKIEFGISNSKAHLSTTNNSTDVNPAEECFEFLIPTLLLVLSTVLEVTKIVIYSVRLFRKIKRTTPSVQNSANAGEIRNSDKRKDQDVKFKSKMKRSFSHEDIRVEKIKEHRLQKTALNASKGIEMQNIGRDIMFPRNSGYLNYHQQHRAQGTQIRRLSLQPPLLQTSEGMHTLPFQSNINPTSMKRRPINTSHGSRAKQTKNLTPSLQPLSARGLVTINGPQRLPVTVDPRADPDTFQKIVIKPIKHFLLRSSTISFVMSIVTFVLVTSFLLKYNSNFSDSSYRLLASVRRMFILILPVFLVIFDEQVFTHVRSALTI